MDLLDFKTVALIAIALLIGVIAVVWFIRKKVSTVSVNAGKIKAKVATHKPASTSVSNIEQRSLEEGNETSIKSHINEVNGVVQHGKGSNKLSIGDD